MKEFLRLLTRFSQQTGRSCILDPCGKIVRKNFLKKILHPLFPELCVENFWTFAKSFSRVVKTAFQMSGGKLRRMFQTKDVILANSEKWANFFLEFLLKFFFSLSKLLHSRRSEKNIVEKFLFFWKNSFFFDHFHHFLENFRTFHQLFSSGLSNVPFQCPDELCLGN